MTIQFPRMPEQITRSEAEIIDYISNNPREFPQDSIGAVSQKLGVSGTTPSRFARRVGCGDYKGLKRLVSQQEQPVGPAAKLLEIQQGFTVESWMLRQQLYLEKTWRGWTLRSLSRRPRRCWTATGSSSTPKAPPPPWGSCFCSGCGGWALRRSCCPPAARKCWKGFPRRVLTTWWCCSVFPKFPGRAG